jgi:hypothetical protein
MIVQGSKVDFFLNNHTSSEVVMSAIHAQVFYRTIPEVSHRGELGFATYQFPLPNAYTLLVRWESIGRFSEVIQ